MKVTLLGQGGFLFDMNGFIVIIDPYLSNSVQKIEPHNFRRVPVDERFLNIKPNLVILTHSHLDNTDPETIKNYLNDGSVTVLASFNAFCNKRYRASDVGY